MARFTVKIAGVDYPFTALTLRQSVDPPDEFTVELPKVEAAPAFEDPVDIYRDGVKIFSGLLERRQAVFGEEGERLVLGSRDLSQKLFRHLTGAQTWTETKVRTILQDLIAGTGLTEGAIADPFQVWHRWLQTTDADFGGDVLTDVEVAGTGTAAKVVLTYAGATKTGNIKSTLIAPVNWQSWIEFNAAVDEKNQTITFDILDSADNTLVGGITPAQLPYDLSALAESSLKVRCNLTAAPWVDGTALESSTGVIYASYPRRGQKITVPNKTLHTIIFAIHKEGSPTGTAYLRIRRTSDDSIIYEESFDVASLPTDSGNWQVFKLTNPPTVNEEVRIMVEYYGGSTDNWIRMRRYRNSYGENWEGVETSYDGTAYTDDSTADSNIVIHDKPSPELLEWSVTHHSDYTDFTVDYEYRFEAVNRLAAMLGAEWWVDSAGALHFQPQRGSDLSGTVRYQAERDVTVSRVTETFQLANRITVIGAGEAASRVEETEEDPASQAAYGLHEAVYVDKEIDTADAARTTAQNLLAKYKDPVEKIVLQVLPVYDFQVGDIITVTDPHTGLEGSYRVKVKTIRFTAEEGEQWELELATRLTDLPDELLKTGQLQRWLKGLA
ncbi:phage tail protein [Candidatus Hecatella orcuttiae]|jgi:hypothetical protein|uniref:phage tail protein n=1 Tax=Candidatus Hecatella orcuttiae TaxID=1935119 RepID=UPI0028680AAE|nr:phage tail protein [Candidatus Hecatella orcuttiae]